MDNKGAGRLQDREISSLNYQRLHKLSKMNPDDLSSELVELKDDLNSLLQDSDLKDELVQLLVTIFLKVNESSTRTEVFDIMSSLIGSQLIKIHLPNMFQRLLLQDDIVDDKRRFLEEVLALFEIFSETFPSSTVDLPVAELMLLLSRLDLDNKEEQLLKLTDLVNKREQKLKEKIKRQEVVTRKPTAGPDTPPPEDYRRLSVTPTVDDITSGNEPYLRPIKSQGKYTDGKEYLDIQFRLLKEDLVGPLREGIGEITMGLSREERKHDIKLYKGVRIISPIFKRGGTTHRIQFDATGLQHIIWEHSKLLISGTLLCFSTDNFKTCMFATIVNRDAKLLKEGVTDVKFLDKVDDNFFDSEAQKIYDMVESPTYFEAYRHVLAALQIIHAESIPFADYIISASNEVKTPKYMQDRNAVSYDLRGCLTADNEECKIKLSEIQDWEDKTSLNHSQLLAIQKALSREFVIIQGPPGTGKTFVGLKITHSLLVNKSVWKTPRQSQVLIVCYTNHALDQFVEGLLKMGHENILRVGSRCQNDNVEECSLTNKKQAFVNDVRRLKKLQQKRRQREKEGYDKYEEFYSDEERDLEFKEWEGVFKTENRSKILFYDCKKPMYSEREKIRSQLSDAIQYLKHEKENCHQGRIPRAHNLLFGLPNDLRTWFSNLMAHEKAFLEMFLGLFPVPLETASEIHRQTKYLQQQWLKRRALDGKNDDKCSKDDAEGDSEVKSRAVGQDTYAPRSKRPTIHSQLIQEQEDFIIGDTEGFQVVTANKSKRIAYARYMFRITLPMTEQEVKDIINPMMLNMKERWRLYVYLVNKSQEYHMQRLTHLGTCFEDLFSQVKEFDERIDEEFFKEATVIAMTTTGAAKYRRVLQRIKPKIVIIEEAAEVLEAHVITSITDGAEHLILIGDHKQLRPNTSVYDLARRYNLQLSLFERMVDNGMECHSLDLQHRMRPEISLVMKDIYPTLKDHPSVSQYPDIKGVSCNLFFIDHQYTELEDKDRRSKSNVHEAEYIVALCWYLLLQGYEPTKITILTLYVGQVMMLKKLMPQTKFQGVRVTAVDNFQGEENDIVLLSLVRSNEKSRVGFSGVENRICVALSRARQGLFVIGNFAMLASKSSMWDKIITKAITRKQIGRFLRLYCRNHPEKLIDASIAKDFERAPDGGCREPCIYRLQCGHLCQKSCHPNDPEHVRIRCQKSCEKLLCADKSHICQRKCHFGDDCGPCMVKVEKIIPSCNHEQLVECSIDAADFMCLLPVEKELPCGHQAEVACGMNINHVKCAASCEVLLACGHTCKGDCNTCHQGRLHKRCHEPCMRVLVCSHVCKELCSLECPPCRKTQDHECPHKSTKLHCGDVAVQCKKSSLIKCSHGKTFNLCQEVNEREPCNMPCSKMLEKCGHPCIGLCCEPCPSLCRICNKKEMKLSFLGTRQLKNACFVELTECSHIFEVEYLDRWMRKESSPEDNHVIKMKSCPKCAVPIRNSLRYGNIIKKQCADVAVVRRATTQFRGKIGRFIDSLEDYLFRSDTDSSMKEEDSSDENSDFELEDEDDKTIDFELERLAGRMTGFLAQNTLSLRRKTVNDVKIELIKRIESLTREGFLNTDFTDEELGDNCKEMIIKIANVCCENNITEQQLLDVDLQIDRLTLIAVANKAFHIFQHDNVGEENVEIDGAVEIAEDVVIAASKMEIISNIISQLKRGRKISKVELMSMYAEICKACEVNDFGKLNIPLEALLVERMGFAAEHWFKSKNGDISAIDEGKFHEIVPRA